MMVNLNLPLKYPQIIRITRKLSDKELEQFVDYVIRAYFPFDYAELSSHFKSFDAMLEAMDSTTGDDFDIKEGTIRIRNVSGASTHNGIRSIKAELNTNEFIRIKVSIGAKPAFMDTASFVLDRVKNDKTYEAETSAANAVLDLLNGEQLQIVMGKYSS